MKNTKIKSFLRTFFSRGIIIKISVVIAFVFIAGAVFAPVIGRYDPNAIELNNALKASGNGHIFGTDAYGRDVFTRLLYGARISLLASVFSCLAAAIIGMLLGLLAGYYEKAAALIIMRYVDIQLSIPPLLFTIVIGLVAGHGLGGLIFAISFGLIPGFTRLMYGIVLSIKESDYIVALRLADIKSYKIKAFAAKQFSFHDCYVCHKFRLCHHAGIYAELSGYRHSDADGFLGKHGVGWILLPVHQPYAGTASRCLYHADRGGL